MRYEDSSLGFEITLPDGWRKLFIFEHFRSNIFQNILPPVLSDGPVLVHPDGGAIVITVQQTGTTAGSACQKIMQELAAESNLTIETFGQIEIESVPHMTVLWTHAAENKRFKTVCVVFGKLLWKITVLIDGDAHAYDPVIQTFRVLPIVKKMME